MKGDFHVRFCERLKLKCFGLLDINKTEHQNMVSSSLTLLSNGSG